ncbi:hypothetical protein EDD85DRAFT_797790 [Armillaria nabsnona]|nr:hypothetical protein EDD85DRAFT_797790 [Armillaria nabsnona]
MTLVSTKSGDSSLPQHTQNDPAPHPSVSTPPCWPDFYQEPIENNIIDGTDWIDFLWAVLVHRTDFYHSTGCFVSTSRRLGKHVVRYHMFKFSFIWFDDLRRRCKITGPELECKMSMLQAIIIRQHRNFNPKNFIKTVTYLHYSTYVILYCITLPLLFCLVAFESSSVNTTCLGYIGVISVYMITMVSETHLPVCKLAQEVDSLNANTFQLIWAVRNIAGLLILIAKSEGSPISDMLHADLFLNAFQASTPFQVLGRTSRVNG